MNDIRKFASITKTEANADGSIQVFGIASTEGVDCQGEIVTKGAMLDALPDYFKHGTGPLRAMHQPIAAGFVTKAEVNDAGETEIVATVVDPVEVTKVQTGVYKGFSIGGKKLPGGYDAASKTITKMRLTEISLVDRPANPEAVITMFKGDDIEATVTVGEGEEAAALELAELMNKGDLSATQLLELARGAVVAKGDNPFPPKDDDKKDDEEDGDDADDKDEDGKKKAKAKDDADEETEKAAGTGDVKKGMYQVSRFADLLCSLGWMVGDSQDEADWEGDNSPLPAQLREWLAQGGALFQAMAAEEVAELIGSLQPPSVVTGTVAVDVVQLGDVAVELKKSLDGAAAASLVDYLSIAKAHMGENDIAKSVLEHGFEKTTEQIVAKMAPGADLVAKLADRDSEIAKLNGENEILKSEIAQLKAQPAPSKATLRVVVEKGQDVEGVAKVATDEPIRKADGTIDAEATAMAGIRKAHQTGGQRLLRG